MAFKLELGVETYRICGTGGEEGPRVAYEEVATLKTADGSVYIAEIDDPDDDNNEKVKVELVRQSTPVETEAEWTHFDDEPDEDGDEDEDDEEEEDVPELVS